MFLVAVFVLAALNLRAQIVTPEHESHARDLVSQMTLEEKLDYIGGYNSFYIRAIPRLGFPRSGLPMGLRESRIDSRSTLYPCGVALAASWDRTWLTRWDRESGRMLGPGVSIS